jgi:hypothetical protein
MTGLLGNLISGSCFIISEFNPLFRAIHRFDFEAGFTNAGNDQSQPEMIVSLLLHLAGLTSETGVL